MATLRGHTPHDTCMMSHASSLYTQILDFKLANDIRWAYGYFTQYKVLHTFKYHIYDMGGTGDHTDVGTHHTTGLPFQPHKHNIHRSGAGWQNAAGADIAAAD